MENSQKEFWVIVEVISGLLEGILDRSKAEFLIAGPFCPFGEENCPLFDAGNTNMGYDTSFSPYLSHFDKSSTFSNQIERASLPDAHSQKTC